MLERDGKVLATTWPASPSDARLRRAQSLAYQSGIAVRIARELIGRKLDGQERLVREKLQSPSTADLIAQHRATLPTADTIPSIRQIEAQAANAYWSAWRNTTVQFPQRDLQRVPEHWLVFGTRKSPLTGSQRLAVNPPNAMLNYLYALLEAESRLALAALGLDPGIGVLHVDTPSRDSLACDLMEAIRPQVDVYVLNWISQQPLRREWFFEQRDGNCRLMAPFAAILSETAETWAHAVAPVAEWVSRILWSTLRKPARQTYPATRLTQGHRRKARGGQSNATSQPAPRPPRLCRTCGQPLKAGRTNCAACAGAAARPGLIEAAKLGRIATHSPKAEAQRAATMHRQEAAKQTWKASDQPTWLTETFYAVEIRPRLSGVTVSALASSLSVSEPYAADIRAGRRRPHPRHWVPLARLVGVSAGG